MGKANGFLKYSRKENLTTAPEERVLGFKEFHQMLSAEERVGQAARCTDCGVPFCQSGTELDGKIIGCPLHNLIPEWNDFLRRGNYEHALERLLKTNNFPEFTSRVCPAFCEQACTGCLHKGPVTVHDNERDIIEYGFAHGIVRPHEVKVRTGKKVAVIGSGPAGLAAADLLNRRGHTVTVYEKDDRVGGLLMYGIPNMKLDKKVVDRRVRLLEAEGIEFKTSVCVGSDIRAKELIKQNDAVILAAGTPVARDLPIAGREGEGIHFAMPYLTEATKAVLDKREPEGAFSAKGKRILVIGGGDTANDCLGTAIRQGAVAVTQFLRRSMPPLERTPENPWPFPADTWKADYGQEEAAALFGSDPRSYETRAKEFKLDEKGHVCSVIGIKLERRKDASGRIKAVDIPGSEFEVPCDMVLIAAGFEGADKELTKAFGLKQEKGRVCTLQENSHGTSAEKVFVAGDMRRGASLVVWAIREGRECAEETDRYLMGYSSLHVKEAL